MVQKEIAYTKKQQSTTYQEHFVYRIIFYVITTMFKYCHIGHPPFLMISISLLVIGESLLFVARVLNNLTD